MHAHFASKVHAGFASKVHWGACRNRRPSRCFGRAAALARSVLIILFGIDAPLVILGGWRRWRMERPQNSLRSLQSSTLSLFLVGGGASAWSVLIILVGIEDPLVILGVWERWRVERPQNSFRSRQPSRGFRRVPALASGASREFLS